MATSEMRGRTLHFDPAALARRLTNRPSVIETVPPDLDRQFVQILVDRNSLLIARTVATLRPSDITPATPAG